MFGAVGDELVKPDGSGTFFNENNEGGNASSLKILDMSWGRIVDIHDIDEATGDVDPTPVFRDFVINETIQSDGQAYLLETNPVTQKTRLVVLREKKDDETDEFVPLLKLASDDLSPVQEKDDDPAALGPFSFVARNAALVVRFNDLLDDDEDAVLSLADHVKVLTNYPPTQPYVNKRMFFDPNFGGVTGGGGSFHSTRLLVDLTVSEAEATAMAVPTGLNSLGLPASLVTSDKANVSVRIPSQTFPSGGQFTILTNLSGQGVATSDNGPVDFGSDTLDVVRAMRSGNAVDENNGFLVDLNPPELLSGWPITVVDVTDDPNGTLGIDYLVDVQFNSPCQSQPEPGNIIELPGIFAEVANLGLPPDFSGLVNDVEVRALVESPLASGAELLGGGLFKRTYDPGLFPASLQGCWVSFAPVPGVFPATEIDPSSQVVLRFSEPMDPATVRPFDTFLVQRIDVNPSPLDIVVGEVVPSGDIKEFTYTPIVPFDHSSGTPDQYYITLLGENGITDLAGNAPVAVPGQIPFTIDPVAPTERNGGIVMRFNSLDEVTHPDVNPDGAEDVRGQFLFDADRGVLKPRPVIRSTAIADRTQAVPGIMIPFTLGVQTPLSPLGSKMMTVWRYCDVGFSSQDESNYNLDIEGLNWSPIGAQVVSDFYPEFEIRLSHSHYLPDEHLDMTSLLPTKPSSGLADNSYAANVLEDPLSPQRIVHPRGLGYVVNPVELFLSPTGTFMMPFPLNRAFADPADHEYYTWRDTAILAEAGPSNNGIDLAIMEDVGLIPADSTGDIAQTNQVPSMGLPLLMEFRCYPAEEGVGLNSFDISLALNTSRLPAFRVFSTGGLNESGILVSKDPDLEDTPSGGFNPNSTPPGKKTPSDDPSWYVGQMDVISRISRIHTIWLDTEQSGNVTDFLDPVVEPTSAEQPSGTELVFAFRGATTISGESATAGKGYAFNAANIDPYGDVRDFDLGLGANEFLGSLSSSDITYLGDNTWTDDMDNLDTARYFQIRVTFVGNTTTLLNPELSAIGVAWLIN
ncbi:MAG: Ig-like domain-containing protein [Planctomycetota bacterium]